MYSNFQYFWQGSNSYSFQYNLLSSLSQTICSINQRFQKVRVLNIFSITSNQKFIHSHIIIIILIYFYWEMQMQEQKPSQILNPQSSDNKILKIPNSYKESSLMRDFSQRCEIYSRHHIQYQQNEERGPDVQKSKEAKLYQQHFMNIPRLQNFYMPQNELYEILEIKHQPLAQNLSYNYGKVVLAKDYENMQHVDYYLFISGHQIKIRVKFLFGFQKKIIGDEIGGGAFGQCYAINQQNSNKKCVKRIKIQNRSKRYFYIQSAIIEVGVLKLLSLYRIGPQIYDIRGFDLLVYDDCICYKMELCMNYTDGLHYLKVSNSNPLNYQQVKMKLKQDLDKSLFIMHHHLKLVHRDLKEQNILFSYQNQQIQKFIVTDFGFTHSLMETYLQKTPIRSAAGTPGYLSPELETIKNIKEYKEYSMSANLYYNDLFGLQKIYNNLQSQPKDIQIHQPKRYWNVEKETFWQVQEEITNKQRYQNRFEFYRSVYGRVHKKVQNGIYQNQYQYLPELGQKDFRNRLINMDTFLPYQGYYFENPRNPEDQQGKKIFDILKSFECEQTDIIMRNIPYLSNSSPDYYLNYFRNVIDKIKDQNKRNFFKQFIFLYSEVIFQFLRITKYSEDSCSMKRIVQEDYIQKRVAKFEKFLKEYANQKETSLMAKTILNTLINIDDQNIFQFSTVFALKTPERWLKFNYQEKDTLAIGYFSVERKSRLTEQILYEYLQFLKKNDKYYILQTLQLIARTFQQKILNQNDNRNSLLQQEWQQEWQQVQNQTCQDEQQQDEVNAIDQIITIENQQQVQFLVVQAFRISMRISQNISEIRKIPSIVLIRFLHESSIQIPQNNLQSYLYNNFQIIELIKINYGVENRYLPQAYKNIADAFEKYADTETVKEYNKLAFEHSFKNIPIKQELQFLGGANYILNNLDKQWNYYMKHCGGSDKRFELQEIIKQLVKNKKINQAVQIIMNYIEIYNQVLHKGQVISWDEILKVQFARTFKTSYILFPYQDINRYQENDAKFKQIFYRFVLKQCVQKLNSQIKMIYI